MVSMEGRLGKDGCWGDGYMKEIWGRRQFLGFQESRVVDVGS